MNCIDRRHLLRMGTIGIGAIGMGTTTLLGSRLRGAVVGAVMENNFEKALTVLNSTTDSGQVGAAAIYARSKGNELSQSFGDAKSVEAAFLLGSISKPISIAALMTMYDQGKFALDDWVHKFIPEFKGDGRQLVTVRHLLTHVSGLPDQLPHNAELRAGHAPLSEFVKGAIQVPLGFEPGTRYEYSSMAIMLAAEIAQRLADQDIRELVSSKVLRPLGMQHSALGMGTLQPSDIMSAQVEFGATESGGGSAESRNWDWNSSYWRALGAPWGGAQASAPDVAKFLDAFVNAQGDVLRSETAALMIRNHNLPALESRGLGFDVGMGVYCAGCSDQTFGHTGSTGTIAWADPQHDRLCVVLTTLPGQAVNSEQHPRQLASDAICTAL